MRYAIIIVCFFSQELLAQEGFRTINFYTTQNGLSNNTITCIKQDSRGFLWIGTKEGLNRFDGSQFKKIFAAKDPAAALSNNSISSILEYRKGQLLIATSSGLSVFNTLSGNFENKKISNAELKAGSGTLITSLYRDKQGNTWVNHSGELDLLDSNLNYKYRFTDLTWAKQLKGITIRNNNWFTDKQNRLWLIADTSGIHVIDFSQQKIWHKQNNPQQLEFFKPSYVRSALLDDSANVLWYAPWGHGIYKYDLNTNTQQRQDFGIKIIDESQSINRILKIPGGKLLCFNDHGLFTLDARTLEYEQVKLTAPGFPGFAVSAMATTLFESGNNNYWLGTNTGLFQLENEDVVSNRFGFDINGKKIPWLECNRIFRSINGNLYVINLSNSLIEVSKDRQTFAAYHIGGKENSMIINMQEDKHGNLWVSTSAGLYRFDAITKKFTQPRWLHPDLYNSRINFIFCDRQEKIWVATRIPFGLYVYSPTSGKCEKIKNNVTAHFEKLGESSRISVITEDDNYVWMISRLGGGIIGYNKRSGEWGLYPKNERYRNLLSKAIGDVYPDNKNNLWLYDLFGTGLIKYNYTNDSINIFTRNDGLPSDFIISMCTDGRDNFWILTGHGISLFDLKTEKVIFNSLPRSKPAHPIEFLAYDTLSKNIIAASNNQLVFYPVESFVQAKKETLRPLIDKVWINNKELYADVNGQSLKLKPTQTNISIDFTTVHYSNADKIKFAYQLSGADHDWKYADASRSAQYAVLTPGKYTFKIKVADENGNWSEPYDSFSFTIVPYFWQTTWFKISAVLLLFTGCWLLVRRRIKNIRHEAELKQKIAETEMMALRAQMNPHFIFNCINSIDAMIQSNDKYHATVYLNKFAKLIRNILDSSKQNLVPLSKDIETLQLYVDLEMFRNENKFKAEISTDPQLLQYDFQVPPLIIQPYVENAILHGLRHRDDNNGKLIVNIQKQNGTLNYEITDNGVGRNKKQNFSSELNKTNGYGMQISEDRVRIFNNEEKASVHITDLHDNDRPAGTKVTVQLKIQ
jgi:ligand-binding sensor domain-containing protein